MFTVSTTEPFVLTTSTDFFQCSWLQSDCGHRRRICRSVVEVKGESVACWHRSQTTRDVDEDQTDKIVLNSFGLEATSLSRAIFGFVLQLFDIRSFITPRGGTTRDWGIETVSLPLASRISDPSLFKQDVFAQSHRQRVRLGIQARVAQHVFR